MRERHHYIPRFLQKGFASRVENGKVWIWQVSRNRPPIELSTKDSGVEKKFYGDDDTLESAFGEYEKKFAPAIVDLLSGRDPNELSSVLSSLVWTQALRTKAIRESFNGAVQTLFDQMFEEAKIGGLTNHISSRVEDEFDAMFAESIQKLPLEEKIVAEECYRVPTMRALMIEAARSQISNGGVTRMLTRLLEAARDGDFINEMVRTGTINGLTKMLKSKEVPAAAIPNTWKTAVFDDNTIILGDICTFYIDLDGKCGGAGKFGNDWMAVCLPISHNRILIGTKSNEQFEIDANTMNYFSSSLSTDAIFSSHVASSTIALAPLIGTLEPLIDQGELAELVSKSWVDKLGPNSA